jgi:hypothetical protein
MIDLQAWEGSLEFDDKGETLLTVRGLRELQKDGVFWFFDVVDERSMIRFGEHGHLWFEIVGWEPGPHAGLRAKRSDPLGPTILGPLK